jgi:Domain of unknown function (DUF4041)
MCASPSSPRPIGPACTEDLQRARAEQEQALQGIYVERQHGAVEVQMKLMMRAFNGDYDAAITNVKHNNVH